MASQKEWPEVKRNPVGRFVHPDGIWKSDQPLVGPLRLGTTPGVGPKGPAVIADYQNTQSDFGTDLVARDRKPDRKFPSDLVSRQIRGNGPEDFVPKLSEGRGKPK
jgi:hypothetical protein